MDGIQTGNENKKKPCSAAPGEDEELRFVDQVVNQVSTSFMQP